jgi:sialate O-acetylesterase
MTRWTLLPMMLLAAPTLAADLVLAPLFRDGAVLQRDRELPVWGKATPQAGVVVTFANHRATTTAGADGRWEVVLPPLATDAEPRTMTVSSGADTAEIKDLLVGEVWLASGQSNMQWAIQQSRNEDKELAAQGPVPGLRVFQVPRLLSHERQDAVDGNWVHATPETVGDLTAVGYFFGRRLVEELGIPVGIIHSSWGGSRIEPWWDEDGLDGIKQLAKTRDYRRLRSPGFPEYHQPLREYAVAIRAWSDETIAALDKGGDAPPMPGAPELLKLGHNAETGTYQAMIHPLAPYALRGFLWYQGESNRSDGMAHFPKKLALIKGWRARFRSPDAPFLFVQLAPFQYGEDRPDELPEMWVAQQKTLEIPHTGMAVTLDIGNIKDIHPGNKSEVGRRLALWALADTYGKKDIVKSGPLYAGFRAVPGAIEVSFAHTGSGLATRDGKPPSHFEVAGDDDKFHPATAEISANGKTVLVRSPEVAEPKRARFAWNKTAEPNLMNREGLPAAAFHTHWP